MWKNFLLGKKGRRSFDIDSVYKGLRLNFNEEVIQSVFRPRAICSVFVLLCAGCSLVAPGPAVPSKDPKLQTTFSATGWAVTDPHESDHAWSHHGRGDVMLVNSFCGEFQDLPLENLAIKTFSGYEDFKPLGKNELMWQGREAFEMEAQARLDGVKVLLYIRNYRRDHCYYDFLLVTPRERHPDSLKAFQLLLDGVRFR